MKAKEKISYCGNCKKDIETNAISFTAKEVVKQLAGFETIEDAILFFNLSDWE